MQATDAPERGMTVAPDKPERLRLDELLVQRGLYETRSRARDAILRGTVTVAGQAAAKPGQGVDADAEIAIADPARRYVSRSALKLAAALDHFAMDATGRVCLDLGASTGGFTQVLLEAGAERVIAIDVGHGQLDPRIASDPRVVSIEGLNVRELQPSDLPFVPDFLVADLSFISLKLALPPALDLAAAGTEAVFLVKPQFEAGRQAIGKNGRVRDVNVGETIARDLAAWLDAASGWRSLGFIASPIAGGDGNREYLLASRKDR